MIKLLSISIVFLLLIGVTPIKSAQDDLKERLDSALKATEQITKTIFDRWQINEFPNFLRSVAMTQTSWEVLKVKYQLKLLKALAVKGTSKFVISFLGSSVTAGHDTKFNVTFSELTRNNMKPAFDAAGIDFEVINGAMGNNPCLPYDVCVKTFAGVEADIVHWEQSYNCFGTDSNKRDVFEQFIRQSMSIKSQPVVVFTTSDTPNWSEKDCEKMESKPGVSEDEKKLLKLLGTEPHKIPSEMNKGDIGSWSAVSSMFQAYKMAGIQMWQHTHYSSYKCHGPYVKTWGCCSAGWHPSKLGHELRAAHYSYFWLLIYKEAIVSVQKLLAEGGTLKSVYDKVLKHQKHEHKYIPPAAMYPSEFSDNMQCHTMFEPRADPDSDLALSVITNGDTRPTFKKIIFEELMQPDIIVNAKLKGYKDFKYTLYGNNESSPLSFFINVAKTGTALMCQPPGIWGKLPNGFQNFWECGTNIFLHLNVNISKNSTSYVFRSEETKLMPYIHKNGKDSQTICVNFLKEFPEGTHVLTVVPTTIDKIMVSTLLIP